MKNIIDTEIKYRIAQEGDLEQIAYLTESIYGHEGSIEVIARWYRDNPDGPSVTCVAEHNGQVIGVFGVSPALFYCFGKPVILYHGGPVIAPEHRQTLAFSELSDRIVSELKRLKCGAYAFPKKELVNYYKSLWDFVECRPLSKHVYIRATYIRKAWHYFRFGSPNIMFKDIMARLRRTSLNPDITVCPIDAPNGDFDELWNKVKDHHEIIAFRGKTHVEWTMKDLKFSKSQLFGAYRNGALEGYMLLQKSRMSSGKYTGVIYDYLTCPPKEILECLLRQAVRWFHQEGCESSEVYTNHQNDRDVLERSGFHHTFRSTRKMVIWGLSFIAPGAIKDNSWYLTTRDMSHA